MARKVNDVFSLCDPAACFGSAPSALPNVGCSHVLTLMHRSVLHSAAIYALFNDDIVSLLTALQMAANQLTLPPWSPRQLTARSPFTSGHCLSKRLSKHPACLLGQNGTRCTGRTQSFVARPAVLPGMTLVPLCVHHYCDRAFGCGKRSKVLQRL